MNEAVRRLALRAATSRPLDAVHRLLTRDAATIFTLHRFSDPDRGVRGHDPDQVRRFLGWLRYRDYRLLPLQDLVRRLQRSEPLQGAVAFTVDDGYRDFAEVGMDVFADFECPVTVFLPTAFLDGERWLWWDEVEYMIEETAVPRLPLPNPGRSSRRGEGACSPATLPLERRRQRRRARREVVERLMSMAADSRERELDEMAGSLRVSRPSPGDDERFLPMTWEQVRACASRGGSFGPHTRSHPWLSAIGDAEAEGEIAGSWRRVREEVDSPVPVLGYPFGTPDSFGRREVGIARECGLEAAVSTVPEMVRGRAAAEDGFLYRLPRFGLPHDVPRSRKIVTGITRLRG